LKAETEKPLSRSAARILKLAIVLPASPDKPAITSLDELVVIVVSEPSEPP
jgi:hypothetical protein